MPSEWLRSHSRSQADTRRWCIWHLLVENRHTGDVTSLEVLHESEQARYRALLKRLKKEALVGSRNKQPWALFYHLLERFARLDYAYAMTIHRSQGSTFTHVFVDHQDLLGARRSERTALFYVAATRASETLRLRLSER